MEEVLGFKIRDASDFLSAGHGWSIPKDKLVSVRLKSESVSIEKHDVDMRKTAIESFDEGMKAGKDELIDWLEKWCKENSFGEKKGGSFRKFLYVRIKYLQAAARKQAGKKQEKTK